MFNVFCYNMHKTLKLKLKGVQPCCHFPATQWSHTHIHPPPSLVSQVRNSL